MREKGSYQRMCLCVVRDAFLDYFSRHAKEVLRFLVMCVLWHFVSDGSGMMQLLKGGQFAMLYNHSHDHHHMVSHCICVHGFGLFAQFHNRGSMEFEMVVVLYTAVVMVVTTGILNWRICLRRLCRVQVIQVSRYRDSICDSEDEQVATSLSGNFPASTQTSAKSAARRHGMPVYIFGSSGGEVYHHPDCHHLQRTDVLKATRLRPCKNCVNSWFG